jgi:hypothetical protein
MKERYRAVRVEYPEWFYPRPFGILDLKTMRCAPGICSVEEYALGVASDCNLGKFPMPGRHKYPWDLVWADIDAKSMIIYLRSGVLPCPPAMEWKERPEGDFR